MARLLAAVILLLLPMLACAVSSSSEYGPSISATFYSKPFTMSPGQAQKTWFPIEFPTGHYGIRRLKAELVDENHEAVPLAEAYLHHWTMKLFGPGETEEGWDSPGNSLPVPGSEGLFRSRSLPHGHARNPMFGDDVTPEEKADKCASNVLNDIGMWISVGSETRRTNTILPAPYGIEIGSHQDYNHTWKAQVHAIDTRETVDPWGCLECLCSLYNHTAYNDYGTLLPVDYIGGIGCCVAGTVCKLKEGASSQLKTRHLKYTVDYVPWDACVVPVRLYFMDVSGCRGEYDVAACEPHKSISSCVDIQQRTVKFPTSGHIVFAEGHQHVGSYGIKIGREFGPTICDARPIFGRGGIWEAGDDRGYVTGMGTCTFPDQDVYITAGEPISMESAYNRLGGHTGVMGQFIIALAVDGDYTPAPLGMCLGPGKAAEAAAAAAAAAAGTKNLGAETREGIFVSRGALAALLAAGPTVVIFAAVASVLWKRRMGSEGSFSPLPEMA